MRPSLRVALGLLVSAGAWLAACSSSEVSADDDEPDGSAIPVQDASSSGGSSSSAGGVSSSSSGGVSSSSSGGVSSGGSSGDQLEDAGADAALDAAEASVGLDAAEADAGDGGLDAGPVEPPDPMTLLRLEGRWDRTMPAAPRAAYPGARIVLRFEGTGATLRLLERKSFRSLVGTSQWSVTVDGTPGPKLVTTVANDLQEETADYVLADELPVGLHTVELVRRTEAEFGSTRVVGITVADGNVVAPPARPVRRLEFVGDSNLVGYGIEGTRPMQPDDPACLHTPDNENWTRAFPALLAARFGAEVESVAYSGKGVFYNSSRADTDVLGVLYPRSVPSDPETLYDASQFDAQAVVVLVGGNDYAYREQGDYPSVEEVQAAYDALVDQIRTAHPTALITCTLSPGINDFYPTYPAGHPQAGQSVMVRTKVQTAITAVVDGRTAAGDPAIAFHDFPAVGNEELTACDYHPSLALHASMAESLGAELASQLAW